MATPIQMWRSRDGKNFPTRAEADAHDETIVILRQHRGSAVTASSEQFYELLKAVLTTHTLTPRVYPEEAE